MLYNVDKFTAAIAAKGLASPNKFNVRFTKIPANVLVGGATAEDLNLMCESVTIAGRNVQSLLDRQYGRNREVVYNGQTYQPINLSFLCTGKYIEKRIFDSWNNKCVDISKGYDVAYYVDYIGEMDVTALTVRGENAFKITYKECWPKTVSAIELNHSTQNAPVRLTVEMTYSWWETDDINIDSAKRTSIVPRNAVIPSTGTG